MNEAPSPAPAAIPSSSTRPGPSSNGARAAAAALAARKKKNREAFNRRRGEFLDDLLRNLDLLVYAELSVIYYMDCYFFRFLLRALMQMIFLTPKAGMLPEPPGNRPYIGAILGSNFLCILLHVLSSAPVGSEATRGYLHGGLVMDFIGQKGPSSKIHLLLLDLLVLVLQITHLSAHLLRQKLRDSPTVELVFSAGQSVDDEERGVRRSVEVQEREELEIAALNPDTAITTEGEIAEASSPHDALLAATTAPLRPDARIADAFNSGQIVIADLRLGQTVHEQLLAAQKGSSTSSEARWAEGQRFMRERFAGMGGLPWAR